MELNIKGASKGEILKKLFLSTLYLSAFTFGGGYVIVTLMKTKFVNQYHWIDEEEMLDLVAIAQSCPGAIAVNGAIVVGYKLAGLTGVLCSVVATVIPPFVILSAISFCYAAFRSNLIVGWMLNGMQSGVGAVIMEVSWGMASGIVKEKQYLSIIIMVAAFIANYFYKVSAIVLILLCIALGVILTLYREKKAGKTTAVLPRIMHRKEAAYDLFTAFYQFLTDRCLQFRRRICCHASDPEPGRTASSMAYPVRIYRPDHHFPDDTGTYCRQFRYLRRHPYCRNAGGFGCYCRLCSAILHFSYITGKDLSEIPEFKPSPGRP